MLLPCVLTHRLGQITKNDTEVLVTTQPTRRCATISRLIESLVNLVVMQLAWLTTQADISELVNPPR